MECSEPHMNWTILKALRPKSFISMFPHHPDWPNPPSTVIGYKGSLKNARRYYIPIPGYMMDSTAANNSATNTNGDLQFEITGKPSYVV